MARRLDEAASRRARNASPVLRNPVPPLIALALAIALAGAWFVFQRTEAGRYDATHDVARSRSEIRLSLTIARQSGPIAEEDWQMSDIDGLSTALYRAVGRNGVSVRVVSEPHETYDVSFLFDKTVVDGIWELATKPPRGDTSAAYTIGIAQTTDGKHGSHAFSFTDPAYWATTGGHQFTIHLDRNKPVPDLLQLRSTALVEPRYGRLVQDFESFGSPEFRARVADARAKVVAHS